MKFAYLYLNLNYVLDNFNKFSVIYCILCCVLFGELGWANTVVWGPNLSYVLYIQKCCFNCRSGSTFKVERYPFYRADSVEFSTDFSSNVIQTYIKNSCPIGLYLVESVSSILQFYHILESSCIYLIILFYFFQSKSLNKYYLFQIAPGLELLHRGIRERIVRHAQPVS